MAHATVHLATAPKPNAVMTALGAAMSDTRDGKAGLVPAHLRDGHYLGAAKLGNAIGYKYSHNEPVALWLNGIHPTSWSVKTFTGRPATAPNARSPDASTNCAPSSAASAEKPLDFCGPRA